jgi:hypothetical protein
LQGRTTEHQPVTAVWRNGGFSASYDSFVVGSSAVLRLNFCAKNPPLRQAAKRYENYKRKGLMTEAVSSIIDYGFNKLNLHRIEALVGSNNIPSLKNHGKP